MNQLQTLCIFLASLYDITRADDSSNYTFWTLSDDLEVTFDSYESGNCTNSSILYILEGDEESADCDAFIELFEVINNATNDTEALETVMYNSIVCNSDWCLDSVVQEDIVYETATSSSKEEFDGCTNDDWGAFDGTYDLEDSNCEYYQTWCYSNYDYYRYWEDSGEFDQYGCSVEYLHINKKLKGYSYRDYCWWGDNDDDAFDSCDITMQVARSNSDCIADVIATVNDVIDFYAAGIYDDDEETADDATTYDLTTIFYILGGIMGVGLVGVCCLALSASSVDTQKKKKAKSRKVAHDAERTKPKKQKSNKSRSKGDSRNGTKKSKKKKSRRSDDIV